MKIKKFNQINEDYSKYWDTDSFGATTDIGESPNISKDANDYIYDLSHNMDSVPLEWIESMINKTNLNYKNKQIDEIAKIKKLKKLEKYTKDILEVDKLIDTLDAKRKEASISYTEGINELLYTFQKDLMNNDFSQFYDIFIDGYDEEVDWDIVDVGRIEDHFDVHPELYKEYKNEIINNIKTLKNSSKYNI